VHVAIVLFTRDLRVHDHPALTAAARTGEDLVPLFVLDPRLLDRSANRARFLMESLVDLDRSLAARGSSLVMRDGDAIARTVALARETGATAVHLTADVTGFAQRRESDLRTALHLQGVDLHVHPGNAVVEPGDAVPPGKSMYSVFTPYRNTWLSTLTPGRLEAWAIGVNAGALAPAPATIAGALPTLEAMGFARTNLGALPVQPGMRGGAAAFADFRDRIDAYPGAPHYPAGKGPA